VHAYLAANTSCSCSTTWSSSSHSKRQPRSLPKCWITRPSTRVSDFPRPAPY
jgi:hypothetical protein